MYLLLCLTVLVDRVVCNQAPNVVFIIADDLGWNDIGYHGSDLKTPVLDKLASEGIRLERHYTQTECSSTRASLLTSRYIVRTGLQADAIPNGGGMALPLNETLMSDYLKQLGYSNYLIGKWHQGASSWKETPLFRGFDYFYGFFGGQIHFFGHYHARFGGYDFRRNYRNKDGQFEEEILKKESGQYLTKLLTDEAIRVVEEHDQSKPMFLYFSVPNVHAPSQTPDYYGEKYLNGLDHVTDYDRKELVLNLGGLEESVYNLTEALRKSNMWENTLVIFISDNGGTPVDGPMSFSGSSNYPLRSGKNTLFEGALRTPAFVYGPLVDHLKGQESDGTFHVSDWFPTLRSIIQAKTNKTVQIVNEIDGVDQSDMILNNGASVRKEILHQLHLGDQAYRMGDYKIIVGNPGESDGYRRHKNRPEIEIRYDEPYDILSQIKCAIGFCGSFNDYIIDPTDGAKVRLYNVITDPSETYNLAAKKPELVREMRAKLAKFQEIVMPAQVKGKANIGHYKHSGGIWLPWRNDMESVQISQTILTKNEL